MNVVLYSTGCPRCMVLAKKMELKGIQFTKVSDKDKLIEMGFNEVPMLEVDGKILEFKEAIEWVKNQEVK